MKNIAIVCGGNSGEYEVSMGSGQAVKKFLDKKKYNSYLIEIRGSNWTYTAANGARYAVDQSDFSLNLPEGKVLFDGVFNAVHGTPGEDGKLQGYLDMHAIPYTSCGVDTSSLTFNKYYCNHFIRSLDVLTPGGLSFKRSDEINREAVIDTLGMPLFIKPARSGSSVGVSKVKTEEDFEAAVEKAFLEDDRILIEEALQGRELTCGVFCKGKEMMVFPLTEIVAHNEFFDYEAKYHGASDEITPADVSAELDTQIKTLSSFLYHKLDCKGFVRFDYIVTPDETYFLEVNTVPGMTEASIIPQQAAAYGLSKQQLFTLAVDALFE
ncbi:MAG: D-alanine--D-alanine ligase [Bacteroidales bacterium]|nr:D-alanine--D-alanine ligase [Bacteroidales bacterium]